MALSFARTVVLALIAAGCGATEPPATVAPASPSALVGASVAPKAPLTPAQIAVRATPSVVSIKSATSLGSGFIVRADGWVATNLHVLSGAADMHIVLKDGTELAITSVVAIDSEHDLAVVSVDKLRLPELALGDSDGVNPGDPVVAIGHPLGLEDTVSNGLVSAVRQVDPTLTLLQISAPIAPGSSGGPLIDERGQVIGIATAVSREGQNLAFGVPSRYLKALLEKPAPISWAAFQATRESPKLPTQKRSVPKHELSLLAGCGEGDVRLLGAMIGKAIDVGAPLYNGGNFEACYHVYEGASLDADRKLGAACRGPKAALAEGRRRAAAQGDPSGQAWAMRDAFDGLLDVIKRKLSASAEKNASPSRKSR